MYPTRLLGELERSKVAVLAGLAILSSYILDAPIHLQSGDDEQNTCVILG
jgi:hypothetical protein